MNIEEIDGRRYRILKDGSRFAYKKARFYWIPQHAGIYCITDSISGLKYVGSSKNLRNRYKSYMNPKCFWNDFNRKAFKNISRENIVFEILEECPLLTKMERLIQEQHWIIKLDTLRPNGLNTMLPAINQNVDYEKLPRLF